MTCNGAYDWQRFWIHFCFGAVVGALTGLFSWAGNGNSSCSAWLWVAGSSLIIALLGGVFGDRFWEWLLNNIRWARWW